ncbi:MAG TPA: DNA-processing protein DprA [Phycisphaerae bacterium]|nr:DNA-processing protein DprA [Phycisphaerae bacterium]
MDTSASPCASEAAVKYLGLQMSSAVGPVTVRRLLERFGTIDRVLSASMAELAQAEGVGRHRAEAIFTGRRNPDVAEEIARAADAGVRIVCLDDADYPAPLRHIPDSPLCLYVRGEVQPTDAVAIAIVGARRCTHYGMEQARRFGAALAGAGFTVVSGLARGIDSYAHEGALAAAGRTLAVLGNGLGRIYPPEHTALAERIAANGALISELPIDAPPEAGNFPRRNRIIIGLCLGVLVVEAGRRSGALITARLATEYNREVCALPGRVDSDTSVGTNALIRDGQARLVTCLEDVLDELGDVGRMMRPEDAEQSGLGQTPDAARPLNLSDDERQVLDALSREPIGPDRLCSITGLAVNKALVALTGLNMKGLIRRLPGNLYVRRTE